MLKKFFPAIIFSLVTTGTLAIGVSSYRQIACEGQLINNDVDATEAQQIYGDRVVGQTFVAPRDGLNRIDLFFNTYNRRNTSEVTVRLLDLSDQPENPFHGVEIFRTSFSAEILRDRSWHSVDLPPIPDSAQKSYLITVESPDGAPDNAIAMGGLERDVILPGAAYWGPVPLPADAAFRVCFELSLAEKVGILAGQLTRNRPGLLGHFGFYVGLVAIYAALIVWLFKRLAPL